MCRRADKCVIPAEALNWKQEITTQVAQPAGAKDKHLAIVIALSFVIGIAVAIGVYMGWSRGLLPPALHGFASAVALLFCPPYILTIAVGPMADAQLMAAVTAGSIVFGNGFLYAGVVAGAYHLVTLLSRRRHA